MEVNRREIYRYLGLGGKEPDERTRELVESCLAELFQAADCRSFYRRFPLTVTEDGKLDLTCFQTDSRDLGKALKGCTEVVLFAATLGAGVDLLLRRYSRLLMSRAVILQACAAAMIESCCDQVCHRLRKELEEEGLYPRPRFSPGYGDFPLSCQAAVCRALEAEKRVGITLTEHFLMVPSKSVTAVIGIGQTPGSCRPEGCQSCKKENCAYRREEPKKT